MSQLQVTGEAKIRDIQGPVIANSGVITALDGAASQYVRGDGTLADFPTSTGGGSSVSYYLNSSVSQGTIGGVAYRELSKEPIIGAGTDITISANGYVASYITDTNDPDVLLVPGGNFNCEFYFSVNNNTGNPTTYAELYKYDGTTFTLLGSSQAVPESLNQGTTIAPYYFAIPVATAALALTDRLAIRIYVNVDGRTVTLHTENSHLCQVVTTFSKGMVSLNNLTDQSQFITTGTSGTNFAIVSSGDTHTFNLPVASATNTGKLSSTDWSTFNGKVPYTGATANVDLGNFNFDANNISGAAIIAKLNGPASSPFVLKSGSSGYTIGDDAISLISSPNVANTLILASNIGVVTKTAQIGLGSLTATRTFTLPDISGTLALLEGTQTFSGAKTFSLDILVNGLTIGRGAGSISTNTVVGSSALSANTTGYGNTSIGLNNLIANTTGFFNVAIGASSLISNTTGTYNAALGTSSLYNNTTGSNNTAVGQQSGESNTTGSNNTYIGRGSGYGIETGSNNTIIGAYTGTAALANNIVLADGAGNVRYQWNGTNNVFGNPISGTSASFSSSVTASSLIKSGGTSSQFLMADGSVNTSVLPSGAYLPLTGGTLTGALSGTSATFVGSIQSTGGSGFATSIDGGFRLRNDANNANLGGLTRRSYWAGGTALDTQIFAETGYGIFLNVNGSSNAGLSLASTGAATFSSTLTSDSITIKDGGNNGQGTLNLGSANNYKIQGGADYLGINFYTNGGLRMFINSSGNVGIGTNSPSTKLDVNGIIKTNAYVNVNDGTSDIYLRSNADFGIGALPAIQVASNSPLQFATNNTLKMVITSGGNVGIGTSSPTNKLHIDDGNYNTYALRIVGSGVANNVNRYTGIGFSGEAANTKAGIFFVSEGTAYSRGALVFANNSDFNQNNVTLADERMRITSSGRVGIGQTSPGTALSVAGQSEQWQLALTTATGTAGAVIGSPSANVLAFGDWSGTERMRITSGGNVLIGNTTDNGAKLQVGQYSALSQVTTPTFVTLDNSYAASATQAGNKLKLYLLRGDVNMGFGCGNIGDLNAWSDGLFRIYTGGNESMRITSGGNVLIGTTTDESYKLYVNGGSANAGLFYTTSAANQIKAAGTAPAITFTNTITSPTIGGTLGAATSANQFLTGTSAGDVVLINNYSGNRVYVVSSSGGVYLTSGATSWTANSDIRLKNINSHIENAVEKLSTLQTINFSYKDDKNNKQNLGLIAQEVEKIFPELIDKNGDDMLGVRYTELVPVLIKAIQELELRIKQLENK